MSVPWFVAALFFFLTLHVCWTYLDHRWLIGRTDDIEDALDRHRADTDERLEKAEDSLGLANDWIRHLDDRTRAQLGAMPRIDPSTEPIPVIDDDGPPTQPQDLLLVREWSKDLTGPVDPWPQEEPDGTETRQFGRHAFRFRTEQTTEGSSA
jgi:hypothetical protein